MTGIYIAIAAGIIISFGVVVQFWRCAYENGKLKELVRQKEAEIKQLKRNIPDWDKINEDLWGVIPRLFSLSKEKEKGEKNDDNRV